jgi:lysophospholipase L1-like esterase
VIIGDSILKNIRYIKDCTIFSLSGAKLDEIVPFLKKNRYILDGIETILLLCGTNNISKNSTDEVINKIRQIFEYIRSATCGTTILISSILPRPIDDALHGHKVKLINRSLKFSCRSWGAKFVASHKLMLKHGKPVSEFYHDGLHLSEAGTRRLRQYLSQRLADLGNKPANDNNSSHYLKRPQWSK